MKLSVLLFIILLVPNQAKKSFSIQFRKKINHPPVKKENIVEFESNIHIIKSKHDSYPPIFSPTLLCTPRSYNLNIFGTRIAYYGEILAGSQKSKHRMLFDTGSSLIWLPSNTCKGCARKNIYNNSASSTYETLSEQFYLGYMSGAISGSFAKDQFFLDTDEEGGSSIAFSSVFGETHDVTGIKHVYNEADFDGIVGLGFPTSALIGTEEGKVHQRIKDVERGHKIYPVYHILQSQGIIPTPQFAFLFNKHAPMREREEGVIEFGDIDEKDFSSRFVFFNLMPVNLDVSTSSQKKKSNDENDSDLKNWAIPISKLDAMKYLNPIPAVIDSGSTTLTFPAYVVQKIVSRFGDSVVEKQRHYYTACNNEKMLNEGLEIFIYGSSGQATWMDGKEVEAKGRVPIEHLVHEKMHTVSKDGEDALHLAVTVPMEALLIPVDWENEDDMSCDYVDLVNRFSKGNVCVLALESRTLPQGTIVLGIPFLRSFATVFDATNSKERIGIAIY